MIDNSSAWRMDPSKPLVVRKEPDYMAGVAGASISSPGPYDKNGNTYYNVGTLSGMSAEAKESYLIFNRRIEIEYAGKTLLKSVLTPVIASLTGIVFLRRIERIFFFTRLST